MNMQPMMGESKTGQFRPPLLGCVARDAFMANALKSCYIETFSLISANIYRSLRCAERERTLSDVFERAAVEDLERFRRVGELIMALGGDAELRSVRSKRCFSARGEASHVFLEEGIKERQRAIDRYETLMSKTGDRVVRSILSSLLSGERRALEQLWEQREKNCGFS